jgi:hypothetical protein
VGCGGRVWGWMPAVVMDAEPTHLDAHKLEVEDVPQVHRCGVCAAEDHRGKRRLPSKRAGERVTLGQSGHRQQLEERLGVPVGVACHVRPAEHAGLGWDAHGPAHDERPPLALCARVGVDMEESVRECGREGA